MRDELTNVSKHTKNIIMNLEDTNGNGSHWVCIFNSQDKYYYPAPRREGAGYCNRPVCYLRK